MKRPDCTVQQKGAVLGELSRRPANRGCVRDGGPSKRAQRPGGGRPVFAVDAVGSGLREQVHASAERRSKNPSRKTNAKAPRWQWDRAGRQADAPNNAGPSRTDWAPATKDNAQGWSLRLLVAYHNQPAIARPSLRC